MADETDTQTPSWSVVGSENEWMVVHPTQPPFGVIRSREAAEAVCERMAANDEEIAMLETSNARLVKHIKRANDMAKRSGEYATTVGEYRDEAWAERDRLREQIRKVREFAESMKTWCSPYGVSLGYADRLLAVLDGEDAKATGGILKPDVRYVVGESGSACAFPPAQITKLTAVHVSDSIKEQS